MDLNGHPTLDRLAEEGPFHLKMARFSAEVNTGGSGDDHFGYFAAYKAKHFLPLTHTVLTTALCERDYYHAHLTDMESKALRSDLRGSRVAVPSLEPRSSDCENVLFLLCHFAYKPLWGEGR